MPRKKYIPPALRNKLRETQENSQDNSQNGVTGQERKQQSLEYDPSPRFNRGNSSENDRKSMNGSRDKYDESRNQGGRHNTGDRSVRGGRGNAPKANYGRDNYRGGGRDQRSYGESNYRRGGYENRNHGGYGNRNHNRGGYGDRSNNGGGYRNTTNRRGGRGGGRSRFNSTPRDAQTVEDPEYELELFGKTKEQPTGIQFDRYDKIPVEVSGSDVPPCVNTFEDSGLHERLCKNILLSGYTKPTPVQKHSIPIAGKYRDLMSCAQTGSGKTAAFLLPMINILLTREQIRIPDDFPRRMAYPRALVLSPTRELSQQIHRECRKFLYCTGLRAVCVYGGAESRAQYIDLEKGVAVLVATPGRLVDFLNRNKISLYVCKFTVLDEADRMLDLGFEPQIQEILEGFDMPNERQTMMFSATFPVEIQKLAQKYLTNYVFLAVGRVGSTAESITQELARANGRDAKLDVLMDLLPRCDGLTLVFVATRRDAENIEYFLRQESVNAESIHGNRNQQERERALKSFRDGVSPILIATDVAARGLDVPNVKWVINYDLPNTIDSYVHRIGRTGRCGNTGTAISLVGNKENKNVLRELLSILQETKQTIPGWFSNLVADSTYGGYRSNRNHRGNQYGGRDIRRDNNKPVRRQDQAQSWRRTAPAPLNRNTKDSW